MKDKGTAGVVFRYKDENNFNYFGLNEKEYEFGKYVAGKKKMIKKVTIDTIKPTIWYRVWIHCSRNDYKIYIKPEESPS